MLDVIYWTGKIGKNENRMAMKIGTQIRHSIFEMI